LENKPIKKISEIHLKILLRDTNEKIQKETGIINFNNLMARRNLLISYASENYPHINWTDPKSYNDTERQSIIKHREICNN